MSEPRPDSIKPDLAGLLRWLQPSISAVDEPIAVARVRYDKDSARIAGDVEAIETRYDRHLDTRVGRLVVRCYQPGPLENAVVLFLHGGGWVVGGLDSHDALCRALANRSRAMVVSVNYRLAPEHLFPAALDDCLAAVAWVRSTFRASSHGIPAVFVAGDSSGGNLAAGVALRCRDVGVPLAGQLLLYPPMDPECDSPSFRQGGMLPPDFAHMRAYWNHYLGTTIAVPHLYAAPGRARAADLVGLAPALVAVAEFDPLRDECEYYAAQLERAGVRVSILRCAGMVHGFARMTWLEECQRLLDSCASFVQELGAGQRC